jgi:hypothetical protein
VCRTAAGVCDVAETCTGTDTACPSDALASSTTVCRPAAGPCDAVDRCTGTTTACPADAKLTSICRPSAGDCDPDERCDGVADTCPADERQPAGTVCRPSAGACDVAESCDGIAAACPGDAFAPATLECRPATDPCDVAEACPGNGAACPSDGGKTGEDAIMCAFGRTIAPSECSGQAVPPTVAKRFAQADKLARSAAQAHSGRASKLLARAAAKLAVAANLVTKAQVRSGAPLSGDCADALRSVLTDALSRIQTGRTTGLARL